MKQKDIIDFISKRNEHVDTFICTLEVFNLYPEVANQFDHVIINQTLPNPMIMATFANLNLT